jgi:hypothetical protein
MALVGVISAETDQAVFPFGKANSIADANLAQLGPAWQSEFHSEAAPVPHLVDRARFVCKITGMIPRFGSGMSWCVQV